MTQSTQLYAVVDIETTGGKMSETKMTELAICITDGNKIIEQFSTLVNPQRPIDKYVVKLTGINDKMVADAPIFESISDKVRELLDGKIFIAHNVAFDYSILKKEYFELNQPFSQRKLCTVKASRKIIPGLSSYSLGSICEYLNIDLENAHRALNDTIATTHLFHELVNRSDGDLMNSELKEQNYDVILPGSWEIESEILPQNGVLYLMDKNKEFIYISSEKNILKKIYYLINPKPKDVVFSEKVVQTTKYLHINYEKKQDKIRTFGS